LNTLANPANLANADWSAGHFAHWPTGLPYELTIPDTTVDRNLTRAAQRYPEQPALIFYDSILSYAALQEQVQCMAGYLQHRCGVQRGDRVLLMMQNSPQFVIAFYAILRADAVVVPISPMSTGDEVAYFVQDCCATIVFIAEDSVPLWLSLDPNLRVSGIIVARYADYLHTPTTLPLPSCIGEHYDTDLLQGTVSWHDAMAAHLAPSAPLGEPDDLAVLPYTSGTTGEPKGCMHTHRSMMFGAVSSPTWAGVLKPASVTLAALPFFHVTGMQVGMNATIFRGGTLVIMARWDRAVATTLIRRYQVATWSSVPTMMIDFLSNPKLTADDVSSLERVSGGGAAMPASIAQRLLELTGLSYMEGYGLTETMAATHSNPPKRLKQQCLGIPVFNVRSHIVDPVTLTIMAPYENGEIVVNGPQLFQGYWNDTDRSVNAFVTIDKVAFFRTGDLGYRDEEGFFFFIDRLKRLINASGFKISPAEVESILFRHPAVHECCVIAAAHPYRGETAKALVVKKPDSRVDAGEIMDWAKTVMAPFKVPTIVEFVDWLPKSATGKIQWRLLQAQEWHSSIPAASLLRTAINTSSESHSVK
jgi:fatty-acyl-CoA synthase